MFFTSLEFRLLGLDVSNYKGNNSKIDRNSIEFQKSKKIVQDEINKESNLYSLDLELPAVYRYIQSINELIVDLEEINTKDEFATIIQMLHEYKNEYIEDALYDGMV